MRNLSSLAWVKNVFVNFVSEAERVELLTESGDEFHLIARENFARWIIGITDDDRFSFVIECRAQLVVVEIPVRRSERNVARLRIRQDRVRRIVFIKRLEHDYFLAWIDGRHHR